MGKIAFANIMQAKMLFLLVLYLAIFNKVSAKCRSISCVAKRGASLTSPNLLGWSYRTCIFGMRCSRAQKRVSSRCNNNDKLVEACTIECGFRLDCYSYIYLTGKADCNHDPNGWIQPKKICCSRHPTIAKGKVRAYECFWNSLFEIHIIKLSLWITLFKIHFSEFTSRTILQLWFFVEANIV